MCKQDNSSASLLILSGGVGSRSGFSEPKQFYQLNGHPMIAYSILPALSETRIGEIITNYPQGYKEKMQKVMQSYCRGKPFKIIAGGSTRQESCSLLAKEATYQIIILHETARPLIELKAYKVLLDFDKPNAGFFHQTYYSMCNIDPKLNIVNHGVPRKNTFNIQLPQKFNREDLVLSHQLALKQKKTYDEDSVMVKEMLGKSVYSLHGSSKNIKITTPEDFLLAESIAKIDNKY